MIWRNRVSFLCALILSSFVSGWAQDTVDSDLVRPSGVNGPIRKAKAVTQKSSDEETESATPKAKKSRSSHARSQRARAKKAAEPDTIAAPTEFTPEGIPKTSAASVIVVDANSGSILYEKNADQVRAPASTQKLLTALIVAVVFNTLVHFLFAKIMRVPLATGLLVICLGAATRLSDYVRDKDKRYRARVRLGQATTTYDAQGEVTIRVRSEDGRVFTGRGAHTDIIQASALAYPIFI